MNAFAQLKIAVPTISKSLNHLEIHSVGEYVIFDDLLRSLIKFNSNGELAPDLAESWEIQDNFRKYILHIKPKQYFSDKSLITAHDVVNSLQNVLKNPEIVHGDGKKIKNLSIINDSQVVIELTESNPFFLTELSAPEFRIVKTNDLLYQTTSGPYYIQSKSLSKISLKLNEHYPFESNVKFKNVDYISYQKLSDNDLKDMDLIWPSSTMSLTEIEKIVQKGYYIYKLNLGFSYWFSLNPNTLSLDDRISIKQKLDSALENSSFFSKNNLSRSKQLFLPFGPGRLTEKEISELTLKQKKISFNQSKKIKVLVPKKIQNELLQILKISFEKIELHFYSDFSEYAKLIKNQSYDIGLVNNDLSSIDLRSSLIVTFNESRPLVWTKKGNKEYHPLLKDINTELDSTKRYSLIKKLSEKVLNDAIVYPLYYDYGFILAKKGLDLSELNIAGAETFSWKIK